MSNGYIDLDGTGAREPSTAELIAAAAGLKRGLTGAKTFDLQTRKRTTIANFCGPVESTTGPNYTALKNAFLTGPSGGTVNKDTGTIYIAESDFPTKTPSGKKRGAKITLPANASVGLKTNTPVAGSLGSVPNTDGAVSFRLGDTVSVGGEVYWPADPVSEDEIRLILHAGANSIQWQFSWNLYMKKGINWLTGRWNELNASVGVVPSITGTINADTVITQAQLFVKSGAGALQPILGEVFANKQKPAKGGVILTIDGIFAAHIDRLAAILAAYGIRATFTTGGGFIKNSPAIHLALAAAGHEIGTQGWEHLLYAATDVFSTGQTPQPTKYDADLARGILGIREANIFPETLVMSMPYNCADAANVTTATAHGIKLMREAKQPRTPVTEFGLPSGQINVGQMGMDNMTLSQFQAAVDAAIEHGETILFCGHECVAGGNGSNTPNNGLSFYDSTFTNMAAYLATKRDEGLLNIMTMGDFSRSLDALRAY